MKKLLFILLLCLISSSAFAQFQQKPMLGEQINWAHPLSKGLVLHPLFNEGSGNKVFDLSGNQNHGTFTGTAPSWTSGKFGSAVLLPGDDEYIDTPFRPSYTTSDGFTWAFWIKTDSTTTNKRILGGTEEQGDEDSTITIHMNYSTGNGIVYAFVNASTGLATDDWPGFAATTAVNDGSWHHIVFVRDISSDKFYLYIDGKQENSNTDVSSATIDLSSTNVYIGAWNNRGGGAEGFFEGLIDHVMVYNRALSSSEIALLYREPFCMFAKDDVALMEAAIPAPTGGQVILISQMTMLPIFFAIILLTRRNNA